MTNKEHREEIRLMRELRKEVTQSKQKALEFLVKTGIYTRKGNLRKPYR